LEGPGRGAHRAFEPAADGVEERVRARDVQAAREVPVADGAQPAQKPWQRRERLELEARRGRGGVRAEALLVVALVDVVERRVGTAERADARRAAHAAVRMRSRTYAAAASGSVSAQSIFDGLSCRLCLPSPAC